MAEGSANGALDAEARAIHRAIFRREAPALILQRYAEAHRRGFGRAPDAEAAWVSHVVRRGVDLLALELVLRRRNPGHALVRKFRVMSYLTEGSPGYADSYFNDRARHTRVVAELTIAALRSAWKWYKGVRLLRHLS